MMLALLFALSLQRVVDGDTVVVQRIGYVRLIGIDTPETVKPGTPVQPCGPKASAFMHSTLTPGATIRLTYGPRRRDRYGRTLAYLWVGKTLLNRELVEQGLAHALTTYRHPRMAEFVAAEARAKAAGVGLWATPPCGGEGGAQ